MQPRTGAQTGAQGGPSPQSPRPPPLRDWPFRTSAVSHTQNPQSDPSGTRMRAASGHWLLRRAPAWCSPSSLNVLGTYFRVQTTIARAGTNSLRACASERQPQLPEQREVKGRLLRALRRLWVPTSLAGRAARRKEPEVPLEAGAAACPGSHGAPARRAPPGPSPRPASACAPLWRPCCRRRPQGLCPHPWAPVGGPPHTPLCLLEAGTCPNAEDPGMGTHQEGRPACLP